MDYERWIQQAIQKISELSVGQVFVLKDLYDGTQWKKLKNGFRQHLGRAFKNMVECGSVNNVVVVPSSKGVPTTYQKV